jgi:hypothetical protein
LEIWKIDGPTLFTLRGAGGQRFTEVMDALIHAHCSSLGIPDAAIRTNLRTNLGDGGVDTEVNVAAKEDETGRMLVPTCWQYKATGYANVREADLIEEVNRRYARELIARGHGYRFCICDDLPPKTQADWSALLAREVQNINPAAPPPMVLTADDISRWIGRYPAMVVRYFKPHLSLQHLNAWGREITSLTRDFVEVPEWSSLQKLIADHGDLRQQVRNSVVLLIQGTAGVGKTRLVYETLRAIAGAEAVVLYTTSEERALDTAVMLANDDQARAILVADECALDKRYRLEQILGGCRDRVRVIAIDNSGERPPSGATEPWLERMPQDIVDEILERNFANVPADRRRTYAAMAEGFVRLAAALCEGDHLVRTGPIPRTLREYYQTRLDEDERRAIEAIALLPRVGHGDAAAAQAELLGKLLDEDWKKLIRTARGLKDSPGFITVGALYLYVTPSIIAQIAFERAFERWIAPDPRTFFTRMPEALVKAFLDRVAMHGTGDIRQTVRDFFWDWAASLDVTALADDSAVERLDALVDTAPETFLPLVRGLVAKTTRAELYAISATSTRASWGPRRSLVWLAERMAWLPECFADAEYILFRLAAAESKQGIGNNASDVWKQLFAIYLPGTPVPFTERMRIFQDRLRFMEPDDVPLGIAALKDMLVGGTAAGPARPALVGGRVPGDHDMPRSAAEERARFQQVIAILAEMAQSTALHLRRGALDVLVERMGFILQMRFLQQARDIHALLSQTPEDLPRVLGAIETFLYYERRGRGQPDEEYLAAVEEWLAALRPADFHGRLVALTGKEPWHHAKTDDENQWRAELAELARAFVERPALLEEEADWLFSAEARSAVVLGDELGRLDRDGVCLEAILGHSERSGETGLGRGYLGRLLDSHPGHAARVDALLIDIELRHPRVAHELSMSGGRQVHAVDRTLRLVRGKSLALDYLGAFLGAAARGELLVTELEDLVDALMDAGPDDARAGDIAVGLVAQWLRASGPGVGATLDARLQSRIWSLLEATADADRLDRHAWGQILECMLELDPRRVAGLILRACLVGGQYLEAELQEILVAAGEQVPREVIDEAAALILDDQLGSRLFFSQHRDVIAALPEEALREWLERAPVEAARRIARHLPLPELDAQGNPVLPALTELVLSRYEDDDEVFQNFCAGVHTQSYVGDFGTLREGDARLAERFLGHRLRRVREWAAREIASSQRDVLAWRKYLDETLGRH